MSDQLTEVEKENVGTALRDALAMMQGLNRALSKRSCATVLLSIDTIIVRLNEAKEQLR